MKPTVGVDVILPARIQRLFVDQIFQTETYEPQCRLQPPQNEQGGDDRTHHGIRQPVSEVHFHISFDSSVENFVSVLRKRISGCFRLFPPPNTKKRQNIARGYERAPMPMAVLGGGLKRRKWSKNASADVGTPRDSRRRQCSVCSVSPTSCSRSLMET